MKLVPSLADIQYNRSHKADTGQQLKRSPEDLSPREAFSVLLLLSFPLEKKGQLALSHEHACFGLAIIIIMSTTAAVQGEELTRAKFCWKKKKKTNYWLFFFPPKNVPPFSSCVSPPDWRCAY